MSKRGVRWFKRHLDVHHDPHRDPNKDEMNQRVMNALDASVIAQSEAQHHAEEAQRLFGAIRREIAITKAKET